MYACIINIYVPHEIKNQCALGKTTSKIMKNRQDANIEMRSGTIGDPDRVNIPCLMHDTRICQ